MPKSFHLLTSIVEKSIGSFPPYPTYGIGSLGKSGIRSALATSIRVGTISRPNDDLGHRIEPDRAEDTSKRPPREGTYIGLAPKNICRLTQGRRRKKKKRLETCHMQATASILVKSGSDVATIFARKAAC